MAFVWCADVPGSHAQPLPFNGKEFDAREFRRLLIGNYREDQGVFAVVERAQVMPRQGAVSGFTIGKNYGLRVAAHLTCVDATREETLEIAESYAAAGVRDIVALRGGQAADRVLGLIRLFTDRAGQVVLPTRQDIADITDLRFETISRIIKTLERSKVLVPIKVDGVHATRSFRVDPALAGWGPEAFAAATSNLR